MGRTRSRRAAADLRNSNHLAPAHLFLFVREPCGPPFRLRTLSRRPRKVRAESRGAWGRPLRSYEELLYIYTCQVDLRKSRGGPTSAQAPNLGIETKLRPDVHVHHPEIEVYKGDLRDVRCKWPRISGLLSVTSYLSLPKVHCSSLSCHQAFICLDSSGNGCWSTWR